MEISFNFFGNRCATSRGGVRGLSSFNIVVIGEGERQRFASGWRHGGKTVDARRSAFTPHAPRKRRRRPVRSSELNKSRIHQKKDKFI